MITLRIASQSSSKHLISYHFAKLHGILITDIQEKYAHISCHPLCMPSGIIELRRYIGLPLHLETVSADEFSARLEKNYGTRAVDVLGDTDTPGENVSLKQMVETLHIAEDIMDTDNNSPVVRLINALFQEAMKQSASDIHLEPFADKLVVRIRVDGILHNILEVAPNLAERIVSRAKIMANLDISEKRLPQDGRTAFTVSGRSVDVRVSSVPVNNGERIVFRILDRTTINLDIADLGMNDQNLVTVTSLLAKPHGIIFVTGPTGSGKTTTLYAMLNELNAPGENIMTVEDPIEYELAGVAQIHVNSKTGMTFAKSLRAILRQDPDIIMIGEIRDLETADIAVQASLTGHLVLSTLHTNSATGTIIRLRDMGLPSFLLSSSLIGIIAQRLIRLLCVKCREPQIPKDEERRMLGISENDKRMIYAPKGCEYCNYTGYLHRTGIYEIVSCDALFQEMIHHNAPQSELETYVRKQSQSIFEHGCSRVLSGETSLAEIIRTAQK